MNSLLMLKFLKCLHAPMWIKKLFLREDSLDAMIHTPEEAWRYLNSLYPFQERSCICKHEFAPEDCDLEVVVPCYNVELYVKECLDSVLNQKTRFSFFVTIVDDGSTDRTGEILRQYEQFSNVKIISQKNIGHSGARNTGISQLHGRYVMFLDSDDVLCPDTIESLMTIAEKNDADIVDSSHMRFAKQWWYNLLQKPQMLQDCDNASKITGYVRGKVIRRDLFESVEFPQGYWFQDTLVLMILDSLARRKSTTSMVSVRYRMNPSSISHNAGGKVKSLDSLYLTIQLLKDRQCMNLAKNQRNYELFLIQICSNFRRIMGLGVSVRQAVFVIQQKILKEQFSEFSTDKPSLKPIQNMVRGGDYKNFYCWVQLH